VTVFHFPFWTSCELTSMTTMRPPKHGYGPLPQNDAADDYRITDIGEPIREGRTPSSPRAADITRTRIQAINTKALVPLLLLLYPDTSPSYARHDRPSDYLLTIQTRNTVANA